LSLPLPGLLPLLPLSLLLEEAASELSDWLLAWLELELDDWGWAGLWSVLTVTPGPEVAAAPSPPDGRSAAGGVDEGMTFGGSGTWRPRLQVLRPLFGLVFDFAPGFDFVGGRLIGDDERGDDERGDVERGDAELGVVTPDGLCVGADVVGWDVEGAVAWVGRSGAAVAPMEGAPERRGAARA
jgi:hypothetical protein